VALAGILPWRDQSIELYHGTTDLFVHRILHKVDETQGGHCKDFGRGFYTTTRLDKADEWANLKAQKIGGVAAIVRFEVSRDDLAKLESLFFVRGERNADDFWSFVQYCRRPRAITIVSSRRGMIW
jgi:uncharacterized protein DUF3990